MLTRIYSIRDLKTEQFGPLYAAPTDAAAARNFDRLRADPQSNLFVYPDDYQLFYIGQFNDSTGSLLQTEVPQLVPVSAAKTQSPS